MFKKRLRRGVLGTRLRLNSKGTNFKYGTEGVVFPGRFEFVGGLGGGFMGESTHRPPEGYSWIRDHNSSYWEVRGSDLQGNYDDVED
jgi:hypothetical protein